MKRAVASSASAIAILLVGIGAACGTGILAASGGRQEQPAEPATERVQLEVVVTETNRDSGTAVGTSEGRRTWHVRAMTAAGNRVSVSGEAVHVEATPSLRGDGLFAVSLSVLAQRRNWTDGPDTAINARLDVVLDDGVPTIVAEASNPANDGVVAVEVTATLLDRPADRRGARPVAPIRVGGDVPPPRKTHDVSPVYPVAARAARVQGLVILEATIGPTGEVVDVEVLRSVPELDEAAATAVRQWRYEPTLVDGVAVPVLMTVTVHFALMPESREGGLPPPPAPGRPVATGAGEDAPSPAGGPAEPVPSPGR